MLLSLFAILMSTLAWSCSIKCKFTIVHTRHSEPAAVSPLSYSADGSVPKLRCGWDFHGIQFTSAHVWLHEAG